MMERNVFYVQVGVLIECPYMYVSTRERNHISIGFVLCIKMHSQDTDIHTYIQVYINNIQMILGVVVCMHDCELYIQYIYWVQGMYRQVYRRGIHRVEYEKVFQNGRDRKNETRINVTVQNTKDIDIQLCYKYTQLQPE